MDPLDDPRVFTDVATGTYVNRNHYAGALELSLFLGLGFLAARRTSAGTLAPTGGWRARLARSLEGSGGTTVALGVLTAVVGIGLALSFSRSGIAASAITTGALLALREWRKGRRARAAALVVTCAALVLLAALLLWMRPAVLSGPADAPGSGESRLLVWRDSLRIVRDYPLLERASAPSKTSIPPTRTAASRCSSITLTTIIFRLSSKAGLWGGRSRRPGGVVLHRSGEALPRSSDPGDPLLAGATAGLPACSCMSSRTSTCESPRTR